jgi:fucose 4-O-acetylase-like acetyltransferase
MLSGMTFKRQKYPTLWSFIKHRAKTLLLPYFMFSIVTWVFWAVFNLVSHTDVDLWGPLLQTFIAQGSGNFLVHNVPLWFLPCLFVVEVLYYVISKLPDWTNFIICAFLSAIGACMIFCWKGAFLLLPWSSESALVAILFYCIGNLLSKKLGLVGIENKVRDKKGLFFVLMIVLTLVLINTAHYNGHITLGSDMLGKTPALFYLNAFMGIFTIGVFSILVCSIKRSNKMMKAIMDYHLWFGRNSLYIMSTHVPVKGIIMIIIAKLIGENVTYVSNDWFCMPIVFILTCAICSIISLYVGKWKTADEQRVQRIFYK